MSWASLLYSSVLLLGRYELDISCSNECPSAREFFRVLQYHFWMRGLQVTLSPITFSGWHNIEDGHARAIWRVKMILLGQKYILLKGMEGKGFLGIFRHRARKKCQVTEVDGEFLQCGGAPRTPRAGRTCLPSWLFFCFSGAATVDIYSPVSTF